MFGASMSEPALKSLDEMEEVGRALGFRSIATFNGVTHDEQKRFMFKHDDGILLEGMQYRGKELSFSLLRGNVVLSCPIKDPVQLDALFKRCYRKCPYSRESGSVIYDFTLRVRQGLKPILEALTKQGQFVKPWLYNISPADLAFASHSGNSLKAGQQIIENFPRDVQAIIYPHSANDLQQHKDVRDRLNRYSSKSESGALEVNFCHILAQRIHPSTTPSLFVTACESILLEVAQQNLLYVRGGGNGAVRAAEYLYNQIPSIAEKVSLPLFADEVRKEHQSRRKPDYSMYAAQSSGGNELRDLGELVINA